MDTADLQQKVFNYLKEQKTCQNLMKMDESNELSELVEEITISQPILVRIAYLFIYSLSNHGFSTSIWRLCVTTFVVWLQITDARLEDVKFYAYTANNNAAEMETIEVSVWGILVWRFWDFFSLEKRQKV